MWLDFCLFVLLLGLFFFVFVSSAITRIHKVYLLFHSQIMLWPLCKFGVSTTTDPVLQMLYIKLAYISLSLLGLGWLVFALFLTGQSYKLDRRLRLVLGTATSLTVLAAVFNPDGLFVSPRQGNYVEHDVGPLFWLLVGMLLVYGAVSLKLMVSTLRAKAAPAHRKQIRMALSGMLVFSLFAVADLMFNVILVENYPLVPGLTSVGMTAAAVYLVIAIHKYRIFDLVRIAQLNVLDSMSMGVAVLDEHEIVLEANKALRRYFHIRTGDRFKVESILASQEDVSTAELFLANIRSASLHPVQQEIACRSAEGLRYFSMRCEPVLDRWMVIGRVLTFQDVTEYRELMMASAEQNKVLVERNNELTVIQQELFAANQKLEHLAVTDGLTGCYNRRYLMQQLEHEMIANARYRIPFAIFLFDIDLFKSINDTYGHLVGDEVIKSTAEAVKKSLRRTDILARYGGEEFTVYLPHTTMEQAVMLAERVKAAVASNLIHTGPGSEPVTITISMGVLAAHHEQPVRIEDPKQYLKEMFHKVDMALYEAKKRGRNRIVSVEPAS
ncbi:sensor domain-containing diguanylate cyclase [Paenibacillus sambharensis]|uniref:Sensor domain-containing diguanylate cyclase n=2 Tax=Paenibacillus sambharensis TaxID=1803190 RepID=A0A2W1L733_9BACL|nr:sensor domain-containing diguanylate cyclase [Paenibacillus sambharensis]